MSTLAHAIVAAEGASPDKTVVFLHGILGSGANWRTFARQLVAVRPRWRVVLVDLRKHGASLDFPPPHTLAACAADLLALEETVGRADAVLGHSFGGKVALEYVFSRKDLELAWVVDSPPGAQSDGRGSEATVHIVEMLSTLPERFPSREAFVAYIEGRGADRAVAMWLAMNVRPTPEGGYTMRVDVPALRALLDDYFARDLWSVLEDPSRTTKVHLVAGGRSHVFDPGERARARRLAASRPDRTWFHVVPDAGHWVHVDAPAALLELVVHSL